MDWLNNLVHFYDRFIKFVIYLNSSLVDKLRTPDQLEFDKNSTGLLIC